MKNKLLVISLLTVLMFTGCGKKDAEPVVSEVVEETEPVAEIEPVEEVETTEPEETIAVEEEIQQQEDVEVEGEVVEGSTLTQEEIDELKANAPSDAAKRGIEAYEAISAGGTYTSSSTGVVFDKVVGTPGEDGWCKFDDAKKTIYFDYDAWLEAASASVPPKNEVEFKELTEEEDAYWSSVN